MDLFETTRRGILSKQAPLANRVRPTTLEEFVGQEHIIGKDKLLYRSIKADRISSLIFYGPPGFIPSFSTCSRNLSFFINCLCVCKSIFL